MEKPDSKMRIGFAGDLAITGRFLENFRQGKEILSAEMQDFIRSHTHFAVNLEGAETAKEAKRPFAVNNPPGTSAWLASKHINIALLANNHIFDSGETGLTDTRSALLKHGVLFTGISENKESYPAELCIENEDIKLYIINIAYNEQKYGTSEKYSLNQVYFRHLSKRVAALKQTNTYIILVYHGGEEYTLLPSPPKRKLLRKLARIEGVSSVICHHSHTPQGMESCGKVPVFYSLGNFIFDLPQHHLYSSTDTGLIISFLIENGTLEYSLSHVKIDRQKGKTDWTADQVAPEIPSGKAYRQAWRREAYRVVFGKQNRTPDKLSASAGKAGLRKLLRPANYLRLFSVLGDPFNRSLYYNALIYKIFAKK
jgi:gamma-polyglutamate biosynthesis protein CapA